MYYFTIKSTEFIKIGIIFFSLSDITNLSILILFDLLLPFLFYLKIL